MSAYSPMYYGVLDLRPRSLTDYTDIRAADLFLHGVRSRLEVARSSLFDSAESVCKLLEAMQKVRFLLYVHVLRSWP